jgi:hypothetical protein
MNLSFFIVNRLNKSEIEGVLTQFENNTGSIFFSQDIAGKKSHDINVNKQIKDPLIFIASFVQDKEADKYSQVVLKDEIIDIFTKAQALSFSESKLNLKTLYKVNDVVFEDINQTFNTINGEIKLVDLFDIKDITKVKVPVDGVYSKNSFINKILKHNSIPYDINRKFVKVLNDSEYDIKDAVKEKGSIFISIRTYGHFEIRKSKTTSSNLYLEVPKSILD